MMQEISQCVEESRRERRRLDVQINALNTGAGNPRFCDGSQRWLLCDPQTRSQLPGRQAPTRRVEVLFLPNLELVQS